MLLHTPVSLIALELSVGPLFLNYFSTVAWTTPHLYITLDK